MTPYAGTPRVSPLTLRSGGLFIALACAAALSACSGDKTTIAPPPPTVGSLNVSINPSSATVVVTGPASFSKTFIGNQLLDGLVPGDYVASASAPGFIDAAEGINVIAGLTSNINLNLPATPIIAEAPRAVYYDKGSLIALDSTSIQAGKLIFYAWLQDEPLGILTTGIVPGTSGDPGLPLLTEQDETAPSFSQNLGVAWVGFMDAAGVVHPVIGADVRWEIDQWWSGRVNSTQFGTSDDNRVALNYGVFDDQADTRTNNSHLTGERFPFVASQYPLYNVTGVSTPFADGLTWVTLFSPDKIASARVVAVATINGEEIGKQILYKHFAPTPSIQITKTVKPGLVTLGVGGGTVTWTVTVTNSGLGDATSVDLGDVLASGPGANYTLVTPLPTGVTQVGDGFTYTFPLPSASTPPPPPTAQLLGVAQDVAVLANATVTNTGSSVVSGQVGVSAGSAVVGFPPGIVLNGTIHNNDALMAAAQAALTTAYVDLAARPATKPVNTALSNATLGPGVYSYSTSVDLIGPLVLDAAGDPNAEFVFNVGSTLSTAAGATVSLINGASICNVYWRVGTSATIGAGAAFVGSILAQSSVTLNSGASLAGRALARTGAVTLGNNAVTIPVGCGVAPVGTTATNVKTLIFTATVDAPGTYCNEAQVNAIHVGTSTTSPVDLKSRACFTAVASNLSLVKDFVAADNATSLGKALTVAANVPAKLRVRVINSGTGAASNVLVTDVLDLASANYHLTGLSAGTINGAGTGYSFAAGNILAGDSKTMLFTVSASADGTYCDTATFTAVGATPPTANDQACLTVATPSLTITKTNPTASVKPSATYTSTIVVKNTGAATAKNVVISDLIGFNAAANVWVTYVSSNQNGAGGTLAINTVTANSVDILAGESLTFTVVSRIPIGAIAGTYCDTATVTSSNAASQNATACVTVPPFSALQTQLNDSNDPVAVGGSTTYFTVLYVEALSNEGVVNNKLTYAFGMPNPVLPLVAGAFRDVSTRVYFDSKPITDPVTGAVVSDTSSPTAVLMNPGTDYTLVDTAGLETITMTPSIVLRPNTAFYVVQLVSVPAGTALQLYNTGFVWESASAITPLVNKYTTNKMEPTTVIQ